MKSTTIVAASVGTVLTGLLAYAVYFDYKRQSDPEFRRSLKRNNRRMARAVKEESEAVGAQQAQAIREAVELVQAEGFPSDLEEREAFFMGEVAKGEALCGDSATHLDAALCFYKALKVYPQPKDLISIYDRTVPKDVLEILAEMLALDPSLKIGPMGGSSAGSETQGVE